MTPSFRWVRLKRNDLTFLRAVSTFRHKCQVLNRDDRARVSNSALEMKARQKQEHDPLGT